MAYYLSNKTKPFIKHYSIKIKTILSVVLQTKTSADNLNGRHVPGK